MRRPLSIILFSRVKPVGDNDGVSVVPIAPYLKIDDYTMTITDIENKAWFEIIVPLRNRLNQYYLPAFEKLPEDGQRRIALQGISPFLVVGESKFSHT